MHKSRYKYVPKGLMVNDKNGDCLGFKTLLQLSTMGHISKLTVHEFSN